LKSVIEIEIHVPQARLAALYADPKLNTRWMDDMERMEPISGQLGMPGSKYRLVPKKGDMVFVATVLVRNLPAEFALESRSYERDYLCEGTLYRLVAGQHATHT
jgi:hypothetical protein